MANTQYTTTNAFIFASENDVNGGQSAYGEAIQEITLSPLLKALASVPGFVIDGCDLPSSGSALARTICANGRAVINGQIIGFNATGITVNFPYASNYVFLRLLYSNSRVTEALIEVNDNDAQPANAIRLGYIAQSANAITAMTDTRHQNRFIFGAVQGASGNPPSRILPGTCDWTPSGLVGSGNTVYITFEKAFFQTPTRIQLGADIAWVVSKTGLTFASLPAASTHYFLIYG